MLAVLAADIGATKVALGVVTEHGAVVGQRQVLTRSLQVYEPDRAIDRLLAHLQAVSRQAQAEGIQPTWLVVGIPGIVARAGTVRSAPLFPALESLSATECEKRLKLPTLLVKDTDLLLLGEHTAGAIRDVEDVVSVWIGSGLGGAVLARGRVWSGRLTSATEIGHIPLEVDGPPCPCGGRGCAELFVSGSAFEAFLRQHGVEESTSGATLYQLVQRGHPEAQAFWERAVQRLGMVMAILINIWSPAVVLSGGGVVQSAPALAKQAGAWAQVLARRPLVDNVQFRLATLGQRASFYGALRYVCEKQQ